MELAVSTVMVLGVFFCLLCLVCLGVLIAGMVRDRKRKKSVY